MQITDVVATVFPLEQIGQYTGAVRPRRWEVITCRVETDEGIVGESAIFSLSSGVAQASILAGFMGPAVLGRDPLLTEDLWRFVGRQDRIGQGTGRYAHACLDVAAWDIVGKVAGRPLYELFGAQRREMRVYGTMSVQASPEAYAAAAIDLVDRGLTAIKLFVWGDPVRDLAACDAVRAAVGDDVDLMVDPAGAYDRREALEVGLGVQDLGFRWFEEPIDDRDLRGLKWLSDRLSIPIAGAETYELEDYPNVVLSGAWEAVRPDVGVIRGITPCRRAIDFARTAGLGIEGHTYAMPPVAAANLHVLLGVPECELFEIPLPLGSLDEGSLRSLEVDLDAGVVRAPVGPGLGTAFDWEYVDARSTFEMRASEQM